MATEAPYLPRTDLFPSRRFFFPSFAAVFALIILALPSFFLVFQRPFECSWALSGTPPPLFKMPLPQPCAKMPARMLPQFSIAVLRVFGAPKRYTNPHALSTSFFSPPPKDACSSRIDAATLSIEFRVCDTLLLHSSGINIVPGCSGRTALSYCCYLLYCWSLGRGACILSAVTLVSTLPLFHVRTLSCLGEKRSVHLGSHRAGLLLIMAFTVREMRDEEADAGFMRKVTKLAMADLSMNKEMNPDWLRSASSLLVALGSRLPSTMMDEIFNQLAGPTVPLIALVQTLSEFAKLHALQFAPRLKYVISRVLPLLGSVKISQRSIFANEKCNMMQMQP